jgi:hypothetical protein
MPNVQALRAKFEAANLQPQTPQNTPVQRSAKRVENAIPTPLKVKEIKQEADVNSLKGFGRQGREAFEQSVSKEMQHDTPMKHERSSRSSTSSEEVKMQHIKQEVETNALEDIGRHFLEKLASEEKKKIDTLTKWELSSRSLNVSGDLDEVKMRKIKQETQSNALMGFGDQFRAAAAKLASLDMPETDTPMMQKRPRRSLRSWSNFDDVSLDPQTVRHHHAEQDSSLSVAKEDDESKTMLQLVPDYYFTVVSRHNSSNWNTTTDSASISDESGVDTSEAMEFYRPQPSSVENEAMDSYRPEPLHVEKAPQLTSSPSPKQGDESAIKLEQEGEESVKCECEFPSPMPPSPTPTLLPTQNPRHSALYSITTTNSDIHKRRRYGYRPPKTPPLRLSPDHRAATAFSFNRPITPTPFATRTAPWVPPNDHNYPSKHLISGADLEYDSIISAMKKPVLRTHWHEERRSIEADTMAVVLGTVGQRMSIRYEDEAKTAAVAVIQELKSKQENGKGKGMGRKWWRFNIFRRSTVSAQRSLFGMGGSKRPSPSATRARPRISPLARLPAPISTDPSPLRQMQRQSSVSTPSPPPSIPGSKTSRKLTKSPPLSAAYVRRSVGRRRRRRKERRGKRRGV